MSYYIIYLSKCQEKYIRYIPLQVGLYFFPDNPSEYNNATFGYVIEYILMKTHFGCVYMCIQTSFKLQGKIFYLKNYISMIIFMVMYPNVKSMHYSMYPQTLSICPYIVLWLYVPKCDLFIHFGNRSQPFICAEIHILIFFVTYQS